MQNELLECKLEICKIKEEVDNAEYMAFMCDIYDTL